MTRRFLIVLSMLSWSAAAQATPPSAHPFASPQSLSEIRAAIAWYGAACIMGASEIETMDGPVSAESLAVETGVPLAQIEEWALARDSEHSIAIDVLLRGGEPLRDPPEPFRTILRQAQSDCQDLVRSRNVLRSALDRGDMPEVATQPDTGLRPEIDPFPFDFERRQRLEQVIRSVDDALAAGDFSADLEAILRAVSGRADITLEDLAQLGATYDTLPDTNGPRAIATDLLLPDPAVFSDLTGTEVGILLERMITDPTDEFGRYYLGLVLSNPELLGDEFVFMFRNVETGETGHTEGSQYPPPACRTVAGSAALACPMH